MTNYQRAKRELLSISKYLKKAYKDDIPAINMHINNACDSICRDSSFNLSEYQQKLLHSYACELHPNRER